MSKALTVTKYLLGASAAVSVGTGVYLLCNKTNRFESLKEKGIKQAEELTINNFIKYMNDNPDITVDNAILLFENSDDESLQIFAEKKHRTKESYYRSYKNLFIEAKRKLKENQVVLEKQIYNSI